MRMIFEVDYRVDDDEDPAQVCRTIGDLLLDHDGVTTVSGRRTNVDSDVLTAVAVLATPYSVGGHLGISDLLAALQSSTADSIPGPTA